MQTVLDRGLQRELLEKLAQAYPESLEASELGEDGRGGPVSTNLIYLAEHQLVEAYESSGIGMDRHVHMATITARGLDFLADDGGLTAILGTVTIKLHEDTLRQMLEHRIASLDAPAETKQSLLADLRSLPSEAIKHLTLNLLDKGMAALPDALPLLQGLLQTWRL